MSKHIAVPKVTVIMITKDGIENECYRSVLNQDYRNFHVIIDVMRPEILHPSPYINGVKNIVRNRNYTKQMALAGEAEYFLWVDSDKKIPPHAISSMIAHQKDIVGGWYQMVNLPRWVAGKWVAPNIFHNCLEPIRGLAQVDMVGLGITLMSRRVMQQVDFRDGMDLFCKDHEGKKISVGECNIFGMDAQSKGFKLFMDGNVICQHLRRTTTGNSYAPMQNNNTNQKRVST